MAKKKTPRFTEADDELLADLGIDVDAPAEAGSNAREERIIAGFEDIQRFFETHQRQPESFEGRDIFERLYAVRLQRLKALPESSTLLASMDTQGLLNQQASEDTTLSDDDLLAELGVSLETSGDVTELKHVRSQSEKRAAEEIAERERCTDFEKFADLFDKAQAELTSGVRITRRFGRDASIEQGNFFILNGQMVFVAEVGDAFRAPNGEADARLRAIFSNGTESNILLRSLQRALYKDDSGRRLSEPNLGPLFDQAWDVTDVESGTIYVLRSHSLHPYIAKHRELAHKIGVTGGKVEDRVRNAEKEATFLFAKTEVVASYRLSQINRSKLENLLHRIFAAARIDLEIDDGFGHKVKAEEWFLVPLNAIDEAVRRIQDGSITQVSYDPTQARLTT